MSADAAQAEPAVSLPVYRIAPSRTWVPLHLGELWEYRELLYFLVWRAIRVRYKQTLLGIAWAVLQPLLTMVVFSLVFGRLAHMSSDGAPYPVFTYCALLPWQLFAFSLTESSNSLVTNQQLITKVYFPRLIVPLASVCVGLVDFAVSFVVLLVMMVYYGIHPHAAVWTLPVWVLLALLTALAGGLWLSALNVRYRDIRYTVPFLTNLWLFATPVAYSLSEVAKLHSAVLRHLYALNPMVGVVQGFRWALLGQSRSSGQAVAISAIAVLVILAGGLFYFRRTERTFADVV
jgi:homopolymeric O-antigen transport system permease protein